MQLKFKSEEHRQRFSNLYSCNKWIADILGMNTWKCQIEDEDDQYSSIAILDDSGEQIEGIFENSAGEKIPDTAWVFYDERQYFHIEC